MLCGHDDGFSKTNYPEVHAKRTPQGGNYLLRHKRLIAIRLSSILPGKQVRSILSFYEIRESCLSGRCSVGVLNCGAFSLSYASRVYRGSGYSETRSPLFWSFRTLSGIEFGIPMSGHATKTID